LWHDAGKRDETANGKFFQAELFAALQETKINPWSRESLHLYFSIFIAFCCACANGYDGSLMTSVIAMPHFQDVFHCGTTGSQVSVIFSLYTVGAMVGAPFAAMLSDRLGRKKGMFCGGIVIILGMIIVSTSSTIPQFVVGRFVLGIGISIMTVAAPAYAIEIAPPHWRGRCAGMCLVPCPPPRMSIGGSVLVLFCVVTNVVAY
jgi:MFS family permease